MYSMDIEEIQYHVQESRRSLAQDIRESCANQNIMLLKCSRFLTWVGTQLITCGQKVDRIRDFSESASDGMIVSAIDPDMYRPYD